MAFSFWSLGTLPRRGPLRLRQHCVILCHHVVVVRGKTSSTTVRFLSSVSLFAPCAECFACHYMGCSFPLALLRGGHPRMHLILRARLRPRAPVRASLRRRLLLHAVRPLCLSCGAPTSAECFEASLPLLPRTSWSLHAPSLSCSKHVRASMLSHLKQVLCSRYAPTCSGPCAVVTSSGTSAPASFLAARSRCT